MISTSRNWAILCRKYTGSVERTFPVLQPLSRFGWPSLSSAPDGTPCRRAHKQPALLWLYLSPLQAATFPNPLAAVLPQDVTPFPIFPLNSPVAASPGHKAYQALVKAEWDWLESIGGVV